MKKVFSIEVVLTAVAVLISIGVWKHDQLNNPADIPQQLQRIRTPISSTTNENKTSKVFQLQDKTAEKHLENSHPRPRAPQSVSDDFQNLSFYRTIIDNNLFRPLGWRPPVRSPTYHLLGTIMPLEEKTRPQAIIKAIAGNKTHIVGIGDTFSANTKVVDIQPKQIILERAGQRIILKLGTSAWLNAKKSKARQR